MRLGLLALAVMASFAGCFNASQEHSASLLMAERGLIDLSPFQGNASAGLRLTMAAGAGPCKVEPLIRFAYDENGLEFMALVQESPFGPLKQITTLTSTPSFRVETRGGELSSTQLPGGAPGGFEFTQAVDVPAGSTLILTYLLRSAEPAGPYQVSWQCSEPPASVSAEASSGPLLLDPQQFKGERLLACVGNGCAVGVNRVEGKLDATLGVGGELLAMEPSGGGTGELRFQSEMEEDLVIALDDQKVFVHVPVPPGPVHASLVYDDIGINASPTHLIGYLACWSPLVLEAVN